MEQKKILKSLSDLETFLPDTERIKISENSRNIKHDGKGKVVRVYIEKNGRKGKIVTIISGLKHSPTVVEEIAKMLKQHCGAGGTVKEGNIEIQGEQLLRVKEKLQELNYNVR